MVAFTEEAQRASEWLLARFDRLYASYHGADDFESWEALLRGEDWQGGESVGEVREMFELFPVHTDACDWCMMDEYQESMRQQARTG